MVVDFKTHHPFLSNRNKPMHDTLIKNIKELVPLSEKEVVLKNILSLLESEIA